jgi:hypothetical protein
MHKAQYLQGQTRLVCKSKQGWFANPNMAGLQIQTRQVCKSKQGWFAEIYALGFYLWACRRSNMPNDG